MPLRPGETFLQGSARLKRQRGATALRSFLPPVAQPPPKVPPVPKAVKEWEKKTPAQKLKQAGFLGAVATDKAVTRYRAEREIARMAPVMARVPTVRPGPAPPPPDRSIFGRSPLLGVAKGLYKGGIEPIAKEAWERSSDKSKRRTTLGISSTGIVEDLVEIGLKMGAGTGAGIAGMVAHPLRVPGQVKALINDVAQPIALTAAASTGTPGSWERLTRQLVQESLRAMEEQYGPETSWGESLRQSYNQGLIAALNGLTVVAPAAWAVRPAIGATRTAGIIGRGLAQGERIPTREAWRQAMPPRGPRTFTLRGGKEAMGVPVEGQWARSALGRGFQHAYDIASRRISEEAPIVGKLSESQRAARLQRRQVKRQLRRDQASAANLLQEAARATDNEQLRSFYTRGMPEEWIERHGSREAAENAWLQAQLDDVYEMLGGREMIRPERQTPKMRRLRTRIDRLQQRIDERTAVLSGEEVGPVADSPARSQMSAVFHEALGAERGTVAMQVADQLARATNPDNPARWYERVAAEYAEDPEAAGIDLANALLQEAGPRRTLAGEPYRFSPEDVERFSDNGARVAMTDGREGWISSYDHDRRQALVDMEEGDREVVPYEDLRDPREAHFYGEAGPPVFYSQAQKVAAESLQPKMTPQQLRKALEKQGVKPVELEWTGIGDWIDALEDSGIKSITREEVLKFLADPLNAFDLQETLWVQGGDPRTGMHATKWGPGDYAGVALAETGGAYKELMIQLRGSQVYSSSGHMPNISNPLVQVRFHEIEGPEGRTILIDELQSDWAAAIRGNEYVTRSRENDRMREELTQRATKRMVALAERVIAETGVNYYDIEGGTNHPMYVDRHVNELIRKLDQDFKDANGIEMRAANPGPGHPDYPVWQEWVNSPERKALGRLQKHVKAVWRRIQADEDRAAKIARAPADMPYKKSWQQLALKRMVAYAVHEGYDSIQWTQGIVPAVRYHKIDPGDYLTAEGEGRYGTPEDHPQYPDESDYQRSSTWFDHQFSEERFPEDPLQGVLFAEGYLDTDLYKPGVPMSMTRPIRMTNEELGLDPSYPAVVDDLIFMDENEAVFPNQFIRVARVNEDGSYDIAPSGILDIEIRGDGSDSGGGWSEYEATVRTVADTPNGSTYATGYGSTAGDALRDAHFDDIADSEWFDDVEIKLDQRWESELDDYLYQEAISDFMERWNSGEIEDREDYSGVYEAEEIAQLSTADVQEGNPYLYDSILPKEANKLFKRYGVKVEESTIEAAFTSEGTGTISTRGPVPTWKLDIPEQMANDIRQGQSFFQAVYPITGGQPVVKGAVELLADDNFRLTLFGQADITTAIHELGHIALYDIAPDDLAILERELAGGRTRDNWTRQDHERYARAWERYFLEGRASSTSLRSVFRRIKDWMREVYNGHLASGDPISPEVRRVFDRRLGKVERQQIPEDPYVKRWGTLLADATSELARHEARVEIARQKGTDEAIRADIESKLRDRDEAEGNGDRDAYNRLTLEIRELTKELDDRDGLNAERNDRRRKLLFSRADELRKALQKPDSRRYEGAQAAADWFQSDREQILRNIFGDKYDLIFQGRREQQAAWLAARGIIRPEEIGEGLGHQPYRRRGGPAARVREAASPVTRRFGKPRTDKLNLHKRNEMVLWQQGNYQASIEVLHEEYVRALAFQYQHDVRQLLHEIGEPVDPSGPKKGWYLVDLDATPLPREWGDMSREEIDAEVQAVLDGLHGDDSQLALQLQHFAENWLHKDPAKLVPDENGGYGNVRQVHPRVVHQLMLPYTGNQLWNPTVSAATIANSFVRFSLIYSNPGYIPSNILANAIMLFAERGIMGLYDLFVGAKMVMKDRQLGRLARAEMGETITTSQIRTDSGEVLQGLRNLERGPARAMSFVADDWIRAAAWSGIARKHGYKTRERQLALLEGRTEKTRRDRERVSELATRAMIDFDRLSPWEQRYLRPLVFVWPFIRGATAWPFDYLKEHPFRAGAIVALTHGYGEEAREELGPMPDYFHSMAPISIQGAYGEVANVSSVNPLGVLADTIGIPASYIESAVTGEDIPTFRNLAGFLAPQNDLLFQLVRGQDEFGRALSVQEMLREAGKELTPFPLPVIFDILDETRPAYQLDQGAGATFARKLIRFSPQRMNLAILNQQARSREEKPVTSQLAEARVKARGAWNQIAPGDHMPRVIEDSIKAYYIVQANRKYLKDEIKKNQRESWQPTRREPKLTELQEAAIVYDVFVSEHPDMADLEDPRSIYDRFGEEGVKIYRRNLERSLFLGKRKADEAIRRAKQLQRVTP